MPRRRGRSPIPNLLAAALAGCTATGAPLPVLDGDSFFDAPWPSDLRLVNGHPDLAGFPGTAERPLLQRYVDVAQSLDGFGTNSPIYLRFEAPIDLDALPLAESSVDAASALFLIDVDPQSPGRGELAPIEWAYAETGSELTADNLLAVRPLPGSPLLPGTRYSLVLKEPVAAVGEQMLARWDPSHADHAGYEDLQQTLFQLGIDVESVAVATTFTTQDPLLELAEYAHYLREELELPSFTGELQVVGHLGSCLLFEGWVFLPLFQEGDPPYASEGGALYRNAAGEPRPAGWDYLRYSLAVPWELSTPEQGWPVFIYAHGEGGDYSSITSLGEAGELTEQLVRRGMLGLSIDLPLHGARATAPGDGDLYSFNLENPESMRATALQAALDQIFLASVLADNSGARFEVSGGTLPVDPEGLVLLGHSQGGQASALAAPFLGGQVQALFLSGTGGGFAESFTHRQDGKDDLQQLAELLDLGEPEQLDAFHPAVGLLQWLLEGSDPINYAPSWFHRAPPGGGVPVSVGMVEGLRDLSSPPRCIEALAAAGHVPVLMPALQASLSHQLQALDPVARPVSDNAVGYDGAAITAGLDQYRKPGHDVLFDNRSATRTAVEFLVSAAQDGSATIPER